ncbi:MAG: response regulator [Nitrosopumilus sp.]|nr:response regulator [Nitrosopumilus sp.]MDF2425260.1 response regulator [Nitrosopumilus sp.]
MPVLDGHQAFKQIKKIDADANVIIIAGFQEVSPKSKEAIREGLIKVISKPVGIGELLSLAKNTLQSK